MARSAEIRDTGRLVGDAVRGVVRSVEHVHLSISDRTYGVLGATLGPVVTPIRLAQRGLTRTIYHTVAAAGAGVPRAGAVAVEVRASRRSQPAPADPTSAEPTSGAVGSRWQPHSATGRTIGILNGLKGDLVATDYASLAVPMALRDHVAGGDVRPTVDGLRAAYPDATDRITVFVHGLCESDRSWFAGAERRHGAPAVSYGSLLAEQLGHTPAYLRYNTGLPIHDNAASLAALLDEVVGRWPVPVREITLIGHSMGGLVIRSACHLAEVEDRAWVDLVRHVVSIGTPHLGAPLERVVDRLVPVIDRLPETRPLARFLHDRSEGIKDLGHGIFDDVTGAEIAFLDHATYCFVGATITRDLHHPLGRVMGDLLVTYPSAAGSSRTRTIPFEIDDGAHVGGLHHWEIVNHPAVYDHLHRWLARDGSRRASS